MRRPWLVIGMFLLSTSAVAEQTLESVESEVEALWAKINAFSAKLTSDTSVSLGPMTMKSHATGTLECLKQGDISLFRLDMVNMMDTGVPLLGAIEQKALSVFDGKDVYNQVEMKGVCKAYKMPPGSARKNGPATGKSMFASFREQGELKLLPDATVDGKPVYVVELTPNERTKSASPTPVSKIKAYISKEYGLQIKMEVFDDKGQPTSTTVYSDINTNVKLTPDRFVYKAPEGVAIEDGNKLRLPGK